MNLEAEGGGILSILRRRKVWREADGCRRLQDTWAVEALGSQWRLAAEDEDQEDALPLPLLPPMCQDAYLRTRSSSLPLRCRRRRRAHLLLFLSPTLAAARDQGGRGGGRAVPVWAFKVKKNKTKRKRRFARGGPSKVNLAARLRGLQKYALCAWICDVDH